jgi:hypothetical protein
LSEIIASHTSPFDGPEFPSVFFLSPEVFHHAQLEIPRPHVPISHEITEMVGDPIQIQAVAETYFRTVHGWWPIISKRRFYQVLMSPFAQRRQELYLVTLSMKLSCLSAEDVSPTLYRAVKRFYSDLEVAGLYEIGHAIYPAAFLSTGACARYAVLLGLDRDGRPGSEKSPSFDEREERRRAWWGVLILDRYACAIFSMDPITDDVSRVLNLSDPRRNVITEDPDPDQCLPVDDDMWDKGVRNQIQSGRLISLTAVQRQHKIKTPFEYQTIPPSSWVDLRDSYRQYISSVGHSNISGVYLSTFRSTKKRINYDARSCRCLVYLHMRHD